MTSKIDVELGPVQTTLLVPLYGRAVDTKRGNGLVVDPKAVSIVDQLDYDFTKWDGKRSLLGTVLRTRMIDEDVSEFLKAHPEGTIVEIGCGLNTRFERLDNGRARWFELDLPDSMELRRRFFEDTPRRTMIAGSVTDPTWMEQVKEAGGPYCFVSEAVLIYLARSMGEQVINMIATNFPGSWLIMDTTSKAMVDGQDMHDIMKDMPTDSWFRWDCDDPKDLQKFGWSLQRSRTFFDADKSLLRRFPLMTQLVFLFFKWFRPTFMSNYRLNRFIAKTS